MNPLMGIIAIIGVIILGGGALVLQKSQPGDIVEIQENIETVEEVTVEEVNESESSGSEISEETEIKEENKSFLGGLFGGNSQTENEGQEELAEEGVIDEPETTVSSSLSIDTLPFFVSKTFRKFSSTEEYQTPTDKRPPAEDFIDVSQISERVIDPTAIVLVRCKINGEYRDGTTGASAPAYVFGTGVVVSPQGHILTAGHLLYAAYDENFNDKQISWTREDCEVAPTDAQLNPIDSRDFSEDSGFIKADIAFQPTFQQYNTRAAKNPDGNPNKVLYLGGGADLDFALLQVTGQNWSYIPVIKDLLYLELGEEMLGLGYPGLVIPKPQSIERIDAKFNAYTWMDISSCENQSNPQDCGIRYQGRRYKADYDHLYGKETELGKYTSYFRGGFSGGPLFYNGHVAGIMIFGKENPYSNLHDLTEIGQWNWVEALSTHEIVSVLNKEGIFISTVP